MGYWTRPSSSLSHACILDVHICSVGANAFGSSKLPIVSPMVLALTRSENTVVPHFKQKPRRIPGDELNQPIGPFRSTLSSGTMTRA